MLIYDLEKKGDKPIYEYIYGCIRDDIRSGVLCSGDKLPSRRQMALDNGIAEITVSNAYSQLVTEGYIESREKKGFFVASDIEDVTQTVGDPGNRTDKGIEAVSLAGSSDRFPEKNGMTALCCDTAPFGDVLNISTGGLPEETFPFDTWSKLVRKILSERRSECIKAPEARGMLQLREAIAGYLSRSRGFCPDPERIIVGPGTEYLASLLLNIIGGSSIVGVEDPGYSNISNLYEMSAHKCLHIPVDENGLITCGLKDYNLKMIHVSPSHHFPIGCVMCAGRRTSLINWAYSEDGWIAEDDYDSEFRFEGRPVPPLIASDPGRVIYMNTFSRTISPSIRISYMILPEELYEKYVRKHMYHSGSVSALEQLTLASFISGGYYERHLNRVRNFYRKRKKAIFDIAREGELAEYFECEGDGSGMTFLLHSRKQMDDKKFLNDLKSRGLLLYSLEDYCYNISDFAHNRYVVNFGSVTEEQFKNAARIMCDTLKG